LNFRQLKNSTERGVAGVVAVTLTMPDPKSTIFAVSIGLVLNFLIERPQLLRRRDIESEAELINPKDSKE